LLQTYYEDYSNFRVGSEATGYRLSVSGPSGTAGDGIVYYNGMQFSTYDADHDNKAGGGNCAQGSYGGFWYNLCTIGSVTTASDQSGGFEWFGFSFSDKTLISSKLYLRC
jgi:hypothetical protein